MEMMGSWTSLLVEGTKRAQHVMETQPVFLFKPRLSSYFFKRVSKPRGNVPKDHAITAGEPAVFAQSGSHGGSQEHPDLPLPAHEWKGAEGVGKKQLGPGVNTAKEESGSPHSFRLCWPETVALGCFTSGSSDADPQPGRTHLPSDCSHQEIPVSSRPQRNDPRAR